MADRSQIPPGIKPWRVGDLTVTVLNDGWFQAPLDLVTGISMAEAAALQRAAFRTDSPRVTLNAFLVTGPDRRPVLIDAGYGAFGPSTMGRVPAALAAAGVAPKEIATILVTHLHPDHVGGLLTEGSATYPNAEFVVHADEARHWLPDAALAGAPDAAKAYFETARKTAAAYAGRMREHAGGEVLAGITAIHLPGHTPGHCGFRITSGDASLLVFTDVVHLPAIQFAQPEAGVSFDVDGDQARATRKRILAEAAGSGTRIAGSHLEFPAVGRVAREGAGYRFVPESWVSDET